MALTTQQLSNEDKAFIKLFQSGMKKSTAFREAYPNHDATIFYNMSQTGTPERKKASEILADAAKHKLGTKYISRALATYQDKMEEFSLLSLDTATELVQHARSEKVRADLAVEGIRHKIGSPTTKIAVQESKTVILQFGEPPKGDILEGEVVDDALDDQDETDDN